MPSETQLRRQTPVYINSFNQPTYVRDTVNWCARNGFGDVTVLDNASASEELLSYFASEAFNSKAKLWSLGANVGPRKALSQVIKKYGEDEPFIFTDPDLKLPDPPAENFLSRLFELGTTHQALKVGLALDISRPELFRGLELVRPGGRRVRAERWEKRYWRREKLKEPNVFGVPVDTTFFLYVPGKGEGRNRLSHYNRQPKIPALRVAGEGFLAEHRPWYTDDGMTDAEREFYVESSSKLATWVYDKKKQDSN